MQKPQIKVVFTNERLVTPSGLTIVGGMLGKSDFVKRCNRIPVDKKRSEPQIKDGDILLTYIGLLCQGKTEFEAVREMQDDPEYYKYALGIARSIPSAETLRQRMDDIRFRYTAEDSEGQCRNASRARSGALCKVEKCR